jgi:hypothetical protein
MGQQPTLMPTKLFLMASTPLSRKITKQVSFEQNESAPPRNLSYTTVHIRFIKNKIFETDYGIMYTRRAYVRLNFFIPMLKSFITMLHDRRPTPYQQLHTYVDLSITVLLLIQSFITIHNTKSAPMS